MRHELNRVKAEGQAVKERLTMLQEAEAATCPVCNQPLSAEHREHAATQLSAERDMLAERFLAGNAATEAAERAQGDPGGRGTDLAQARAAATHGSDKRPDRGAIADCEAAAAEQAGVASR